MSDDTDAPVAGPPFSMAPAPVDDAEAEVGDEAGIAKYKEVFEGLSKLLYYGGKPVPVARAAQLLDLTKDFEDAIIAHGPGLVKDAAGAAITNDNVDAAHKLRWWRATGLPARRPTDVLQRAQYNVEIYAPALDVISGGAFLAYAAPSVIERLYIAIKPVAAELADLPAGLVAGVRESAANVVHEVAKTPAALGGAAASGLGLTGGLMIAGGVVAALILIKR